MGSWQLQVCKCVGPNASNRHHLGLKARGRRFYSTQHQYNWSLLHPLRDRCRLWM